jgi:hypothetical protein
MYITEWKKPEVKSPIFQCLLCPTYFIRITDEIMYNHQRLLCPFCECYLKDDGEEKPNTNVSCDWLYSDESFFI